MGRNNKSIGDGGIWPIDRILEKRKRKESCKDHKINKSKLGFAKSGILVKGEGKEVSLNDFGIKGRGDGGQGIGEKLRGDGYCCVEFRVGERVGCSTIGSNSKDYDQWVFEELVKKKKKGCEQERNSRQGARCS